MTTPHQPGPNSLNPMQRGRLLTALWAAERGWHVFPAHPATKRAAIKQWEQRATTDPDRITAFWTANPDHNIAIACGPSGLLVIDLDQPKPAAHDAATEDGLSMSPALNGAGALGQLASRADAELPATHTVRTPSGGTHLYYQAPATPRLGNTAGLLAPLVDTRGAGGCVIAPTSTTPTGAYELIDDQDPADLPGWITRALTARPAAAATEPATVDPARLGAYARAVVAAETALVRGAPPKRHNHTLFVAACRLGELVGAGVLDPATATHMLQQAAATHVASTCHCTAREAEATIRSGLSAGAQRPRKLPGKAA